MPSLYVATEFRTDLQTLGFLGNHTSPKGRVAALKKALGLDLPRTGRWLVRVAVQHGLGRAEFPGWILAGDHRPEPAGLPTLLRRDAPLGPDALPSAFYGGLLRLGQSPNGGYWGAELHKKTMPVHLYDPSIEGIRAGWRRRFDRLDQFLFYAAKASLAQRDRITVEEFVDLLRELGVRPEELVPDALEDEREQLARLGLRRPKKLPVLANRFVWLDALIAGVLGRPAHPEEIARLWVDAFRLHMLREDHDPSSNASVSAFWLLRHALFGDSEGYQRALARASRHKTANGALLVVHADAEARRWWAKKGAPFDRVAVARAIEQRSGRHHR